MSPNTEIFIFKILAESFGPLLQPGADAIHLQRKLNIRSVEDIPLAVERAGYEITYVDLPTKVSGAAQVIEGSPHIMVNRTKSSLHKTFTIAHELGHHQLHLNPLRDTDQKAQVPNSTREFEENMFGTMFVAPLTSGEKQEQLLAHNPEIRSSLTVCVVATLVAILMAVVIWFCFRPFPAPDPAVITTT